MTKVCISGYYGFDNAGDEAILLAMIQGLQKEFPDIEISVLSNNPEKTEAEYGVKAYDRWKWWQIQKAIMEADILISGGGGLLQDVTGRKSIMYYTHVMKMALHRKRPVFIFSQGVGPVNDNWSRNHAAKVLRKAARITVRDEDSAALLHRWGLRRGRIHVTADPVLTLGDGERVWDVKRFVKAIENALPAATEDMETEIEINIVDEATLHSLLAENAAKVEAEAAKGLSHKTMNAAAFAQAEEKVQEESETANGETTPGETAESEETPVETTVEEAAAPTQEEPVMAVEGYGIMGLHPSLWTEEDEKLALFSLRKWKDLPVADLAAVGDMTVQAGYKVVFLPFQYPADLEVSKEVQEAMTEEAYVFDGQTPLTPKEILTVMDHADFVFGMRLHSLIMAVVTKTPFASLSYDPKVFNFVQQMGLNVTGDLEFYDSAEFLKNFEAALGALSEVEELIEEKLPELTEKAQSVMDSLHLVLDRISRRNARKSSGEAYVKNRKKDDILNNDEELPLNDESPEENDSNQTIQDMDLASSEEVEEEIVEEIEEGFVESREDQKEDK